MGKRQSLGSVPYYFIGLRKKFPAFLQYLFKEAEKAEDAKSMLAKSTAAKSSHAQFLPILRPSFLAVLRWDNACENGLTQL